MPFRSIEKLKGISLLPAERLIIGLVFDFEDRGDPRGAKIGRLIAGYERRLLAGDAEVALEYLADIGNLLDQEKFEAGNFWEHMRSLAMQLGMSPGEIEGLLIPNTSPNA